MFLLLKIVSNLEVLHFFVIKIIHKYNKLLLEKKYILPIQHQTWRYN